jgi:thiamine-phosphate pyrophosphorylase
MQLLVVSHPRMIANEAEVINALFDEGLELFHLRKPTASENELTELLQNINAGNYSKIAIHQHHLMAENFGIKRIHFSEANRLGTTEEKLKKWKAEKYVLSTSIHSINDHRSLSDNFSYTFLGPVFESISKPEYKPASAELIQLEEDKNRKIKIIAIGGITAEKIKMTEQANFDGAALLGTIWNDSINAIKNFKKCLQNVNMY